MSSLVFELGVSSVDAVEVMPHTSFKNREKMIRSDFRSSDGTLFSYKWGDYKQFDFKTEFVPSNSAMLINSWWNSQSELLFFINSGSGIADQVIDYSEVFSDYTFINMTRGVTSEDYMKIIEDTTSDYHYLVENFNGIVPNKDLVYTIKLKGEEKNKVRVGMQSDVQGHVLGHVLVDLDNGSFTNQNSDVVFQAIITSEADDFYRATVGVRFTNVESIQVVVLLVNSNDDLAYDGDGTSGIWAGNATLTGAVVATEVHSVMLRNKYSPFDRFQKPYVDKYKGRIILETY